MSKSKPGRYRAMRAANSGMHMEGYVNLTGLQEEYPVMKIQGKGTPSTYEGKVRKLKEQAIRARRQRQAEQDNKCIVNWPFELVDKSTCQRVKLSEMTEREAAIKNRSIEPLGLYWRRAPY